MKSYKHRLNNFQITFSFSVLVGESFLNKPFCPFLMNLKATDIHFLYVSEKTQSVLDEFYEPVFCKIFLATLYTDRTSFLFATVVELKIPPDIHFLGVCLSLCVGICWFL